MRGKRVFRFFFCSRNVKNLCSSGRMIMICIPFDSPEVGEHFRYPSHADLTSRTDSVDVQSEINFQKTPFSPFFEQFFTHFDLNFMENQKKSRQRA